MSKKESGLGRGLGDLLMDNAPEVRTSGSVVKKDTDREISITHTGIASENERTVIKNADNYIEITSKPYVYTPVTPIKAEAAPIIDDNVNEKPIEEIAEEKVDLSAISDDDLAKNEARSRSRSLKALFREYK